MKKRCKNIDITDLTLIEECVDKCLKKKKKNRTDIVRLFERYGTKENVAACLQKELIDRKLELVPIYYRTVYDKGSHKERNIGIQDIKQQIYDYIAVAGLSDLVKGIGKYQCASLPERGQIYGTLAIHRWVNEKERGKYRVRYVCKFDIKKYYESIPQEKILEWLKRRVKNGPLLWLIGTLLKTFEKGLSIGSYLSQYLGNIYLSDLYHKIQEQLFKIRERKDGTSKRMNLVSHTLFYMDDLLICGSNSKDLMKVVDFIDAELDLKGLSLKPNWRCFKMTDETFIDMMGFRIYRDHIEIRRETFRKIKRSINDFRNNLESVESARTLLSYKGILEHSNSQKFMKSNNLYALFKKARKVVSNYDKSKIFRAEAERRNTYI